MTEPATETPTPPRSPFLRPRMIAGLLVLALAGGMQAVAIDSASAQGYTYNPRPARPKPPPPPKIELKSK